jgi:glycosyltransferase involved in cell wall biosynthesis
MNRHTPLVSVGIPVYNGEKFLPQALDCVLSQTFQNFELVISDNASTDRTAEICQEYVKRDSRIRYHRNDRNVGIIHNYNRVFNLCHGKYFKWAAADDLYEPDFLQLCVEVLDTNPDVIVCYSKTKIIDENGAAVEDYERPMDLSDDSPKKRFVELYTSIGECNAAFGLIRTSVLKETGLYGNYFGCDLCLLAKLTLYGKFYEIPERLFYRREHSGSSSYDKSTERQLEFFYPGTGRRIVLPAWRKLFAYLGSIVSAPVTAKDKLSLLAYVTSTARFKRKRYLKEIGTALALLTFRRHERTRAR